MKKVSALLNRISNWRTFVGLLAAYAMFPMVFFKNAGDRINSLAGKDIAPIDLTFGFNPDSTQQMVKAYGDAGRSYYARVEMTTDVVYPIVYAFLFGVILTMIYTKLWKKPIQRIHLLPFLCMLFDFSENITIVAMLKLFPTESLLLATLCELFKLLKWSCLGIIFLAIFGGLVSLLFRNYFTKPV